LKKYILDEDGNPQQEDDIAKWGAWFENEVFRRVHLTRENGITVSTVFLGIDHNFFEPGKPILWETMVFKDGDGFKEFYSDRYSSKEDATAGHKKACDTFGVSFN
jgi:hypothetical protein